MAEQSQTTTNSANPKDPTISYFKRIVIMQGDFLVLLTAALIIFVYVTVKDVKIPNQTALNLPPPFEVSSVQLTNSIYQNGKLLHSGDVVTNPQITILGQIMDFDKIQSQWPNYAVMINGNEAKSNASGAYQQDLTLNNGANVIEISVRLDGKYYDSQQTVINYQMPETK